MILLRRMPRASHAAAVVGGVAALLGVTATAYGSGAVPQLEGSPGVALHGALLGLVASVGVLALQPDTGLVAQLREPGRIGTLVRQFTVVAVALPFVVGALGMLGIRSGRYEAAFAVALVSTAWTGVLLAARLVGRSQRRPGRARATCPATTRARAATGSPCSPRCPTSSPRPPTSTRPSTG